MARIPPLAESFVKSSTENITDHHVTDSDVTTNVVDVTTNNNDDVMRYKDINTDMSIDTGDVTTKECKEVLKDTDDNCAVTEEHDDVMENVDDITDDVTNDQIELKDTCEENETNKDVSTGSADRLPLRVKQDLRKIKTTVEFVEEDVRDIVGCADEWDVNNSESEEEGSWEPEENTGDYDINNETGDTIHKNIGDDDKNIGADDKNIGDDCNIDSDIYINNIGDIIDNDDDICTDGDQSDHGDLYDDKEDNNSNNRGKIKCEKAADDDGSKVALKKTKKLPKGERYILTIVKMFNVLFFLCV
jgi:hypothetical protein